MFQILTIFHFLFPQIASGRHRLATSALRHLIGAAVGFADLLIGLRRSIGGVGRVRRLCGEQHSR
jgi:hypothetical protein